MDATARGVPDGGRKPGAVGFERVGFLAVDGRALFQAASAA